MNTVIENLGNTDKLTVQKSKPLFALWQSSLTLAEFKILDTYLGRINSHDPDHRTVVFEKGELENILGIKQLKRQVLDDRLKNLMTTVCIPDESSKRGFTRIALFEKAHAEQDDYGLWKVELSCTESARKYIFNLEEIQYLRYKLKNIVNIKSRYTYIMFLYLWENKYRGTWTIPLNELKELLNCNTEETYKQFKRFNDLILKKVHKEIHEVTDIKYTYATIKKGRTVVAIQFTYIPEAQVKEPEEIPGQMTIDYETVPHNNLWETPLMSFGFTREQLDELDSVLVSVPESILPDTENTFGDIKLRRYHYMNQKAKELKRIASERNVRNNFAYLKKMIQKDVQ